MAGKTSVAPWSVKGVERSTREAARQGAQAAGMTVGSWIEQAIRSHETLLAPGAPTPEADPMAEVLAAAQRAEVRSLEAGVERAESRTGDMVIPVALKVQELAHRLVEIEQARVAGRTRPPAEPKPATEPPPPEDDFERFLVPEPEPEPVAQAPAPAEEFPTPVPPPEDDFERFRQPEPEPEPLVFGAENEIPQERPHRRAWVGPRSAQPKRRSGFRRALGRVIGAAVALALGAGSAILVLDHGELVGLPPRLVDHVAGGLDRAVTEGRRLAQAGEEAVGDLIHDIRALFEEAPTETGMATPTDLPMAEAPPPAPPPPVMASVATPAPPPPSAVPAPMPAASPAPPPSASTPSTETPTPPSVSAAAPPPSPAPPPTMNGTATTQATPSAPQPATTPTPALSPPPQVSALPPATTTPAPTPPASSPPPPQTAALPPTTPPMPAPATPTPSAPTTEPQSFPTLEQPKEVAPPAREAETLEKAARQGDVKAQYELGVLAVQPETGQPDYGKAAYWFREAAVQGNQSAQYNLGVLYEHGLGVGQDDVRALLWYHSAAEQGHARAQYNLGVFYAQGRGIPTDYGEAQRSFKRSADQGIAKAFYNLAILAEGGLGGPANQTAARAFMSRAALLGDPEARAALAKRPAPRPDPARADAARPSTEVIGAVQHMLGELGYDAGRADGLLGDKTRQAIRKFQSDNGLQQTGVATEELLEVLTAKLGPAISTPSSSSSSSPTRR